VIMHKEEVEKHLRRTEAKLEKLFMQRRLQWLQQILKEAQDRYSFKTLGELVASMVDHSADISQE